MSGNTDSRGVATRERQVSVRAKVLITVGSLFFFLALTEIGLRMAGRHYLSQTVTAPSQVDGSETNTRILCVGDSFTFGGRVGRSETYPAQLGDLIRQRVPGRKFQVFNQGVCEYNSWQLLQFLPEWLATYRPAAVVVLVGSANRFNPWGYDWARDTGLLSAIERAVTDLRVVKMVRLIVLNLRGRALSWSGSSVHFDETPVNHGIDGHHTNLTPYLQAKEYLSRKFALKQAAPSAPADPAWVLYDSGDVEQAKAVCARALADTADSEELLCAAGYFEYKTGNYAAAEKLYQRALAAHRPPSDFAASQASFFYSNAGRDSLLVGKYDSAIDFFFRAILFNPDDEYMYYAMSKAFDLQSTYDSAYIMRRCQELMVERPDLRENPKFQNHIAMFQNKEQWDRGVEQWLARDLDQIVRLCRQSKAEVIFQNYPVSYPLANGVLQQAAARNHLPIVDNLSAFNNVLAREERSQYLFDDDHCTPAGHRIMAEDVFATLVAEGVVPHDRPAAQ
jgi:lysophospholipase L1-like esterase